MVEVKLTDAAIDDLNKIAEYIAKDSIRYAQITVNTLFESVFILEELPYAGKVVKEFKKTSIRELVKENYRIVYRIVNEHKIDILTFHHSKRSLKRNVAVKNLKKKK
jgi:addiction module RelE/StbE family toxin